MISIEEAQNHFSNAAKLCSTLTLPIEGALGFALAVDVVASENVPPFPRAMMDGFAVRSEDVHHPPVSLKVNTTIPAGTFSDDTVGPGSASKIMTGAPVPPGATSVQKIEVCRELEDGYVEILESVGTGKNIAAAGSEFPKGDLILERGHVLQFVDMGILATFGYHSIPVINKPSVCLINTGSELVDVRQQPGQGKIRNSNQYTIASLLAEEGFFCEPRGIVEDTEESITSTLKDASRSFEVILLTGGVSVGEFDFVETCARKCGFEVLMDKVAMKPGKPLLLAKKENCVLIGLAGNPVSSMIQCALFITPFLRTMAGWKHPRNRYFKAKLTGTVTHRPERSSLRPAIVYSKYGSLFCTPVHMKGSADLFSFRGCNSFYILPADLSELKAGDEIDVILLRSLREDDKNYGDREPDSTR